MTGGKLAAALLCLLLLGGCAPLSVSTEELLVPPQLNERQTKVEEALSATAELAGIHYRYPQSGDHRSPFVFYDIDEDGALEAVVFFTDAQEETVRAKVLRENADGSWSPLQELSGNGDQVDFIRFANVVSSDSLSMIIGWRNSRRAASSLEIYSFSGGLLERQTPPGMNGRIDYHSLSIADYLRDGLNEILYVWQDSGDLYRLQMLGATPDGRLDTLGSLPLSPDLNGVLQLLPGRLSWDGGAAVYIDERRTDTYIATEVVRVSEQGLAPLVGEQAFDLYSLTFRGEETLCVDERGNGSVEIPLVDRLPALIDDPLGTPTLTRYMRLAADGLEPVRHAAVNETAGYRVTFPEKWVEHVTIQRSPENDGEWRFYSIDSNTGQPLGELLRVRVYSNRDFQDQFVQRNYHLLAEQGIFLYYGYIPPTTGEPLAITYQELEGMFRLI